MFIPATSIQLACQEHEGRTGHPVLAYDHGWWWKTDTEAWPASDGEAADALLERVLVLESELMDLQHRARVGDALVLSLQAEQLMSLLPAVQDV